ncbi:hypothetical protein BH23PAT2_BH23PAT2_01220 [soil metagenome]
MQDIRVNQLDGEGSAYIFEVTVGEQKYKVNLSEEYYQELTGGKVTPEELVKRSFEFLLKRESPEAILPEFALPLINNYFPDYEKTMQQMLNYS